MNLEISQIPVLGDNYIYMLFDPITGVRGVVDPAVAQPVIKFLDSNHAGLDFIFNTHHHYDHVGGNLELKQRYGCQIIGPAADHARIPGIDTHVGDGDVVYLGQARALVFDTPGHTKGHIAFFFDAALALFCGDTLFSVGCGRLFEGTAEQMWNSLQKLRHLPDSTRVYCAHEYTQDNLRFALALEPDHQGLLAYSQEVDRLRAMNQPTIPANLGREKLCNPFLRADAADLGILVAKSNGVEVFAEIRRRKDNF